ncbi:DUF488 domain-containing protein [Spelaeicoccus albus]|uniref:Uncharacterized protein (DUF488 family) n=1 Tax=Spelaeicoccus albus TaxID=1280376 RepID=A0A7Z0A9C3_9MICO|nr:DUF488 domain-containing protein [Spelaeicoccus albus]NYI65955.1 uncharacterized protein (DUF488 family) [Spelaeicoccus albus]
MVVYTIGHSTRSVEDVERMLAGAGVDLVADIRSFPSSRKNPQWARDKLAERWDGGYVWLGEKLGGRRKVTGEDTNAAWEHPAFRGYADWMQTTTFAEGMDELTALTRDHTVSIMCAEAVWWRCHRRMVTDALIARGYDVRHLMDNGPHEASLTKFARVDGQTVTYPA